jgi:hypothetical protein
MELIAAAVAFYAIVLPVFLALEMGGSHPGAPRWPARRPSAEEAAEAWLAAHPLKSRPAVAAANDDLERLAA